MIRSFAIVLFLLLAPQPARAQNITWDSGYPSVTYGFGGSGSINGQGTWSVPATGSFARFEMWVWTGNNTADKYRAQVTFGATNTWACTSSSYGPGTYQVSAKLYWRDASNNLNLTTLSGGQVTIGQ